MATPRGARAFAHHFAASVHPRLETAPGFRSAYLLDRDQGDLVGLTVITVWDSIDAITAFTGESDPDAAVLDKDTLSLLLDYDASATHHDVLVADERFHAPNPPATVFSPRHRQSEPR